MLLNPYSLIEKILQNQRAIMATLADFNAKLDSIKSKIDADLSADAAKIADLTKQLADAKAQAAAGGLTPDEEAQLFQRISDIEAQIPAAAA